jgi:hypothetical protein
VDARYPYHENDPISDEMGEYINETNEGMVSTKDRDTIVANRILFNTDVLVNPVLRCEVTSVTFREKSNEGNGLTYELNAKVTETNPDQTKKEKEAPVKSGWSMRTGNGRSTASGWTPRTASPLRIPLTK